MECSIELSHIYVLFSRLSVIQDTVVLAINQEYVASGDDPLNLQPNDEVAVIPPISGG